MSISCAPADLVRAAKCFPCVPRGARRWVRAYLLCQFAVRGIGPSAPVLDISDASVLNNTILTWTQASDPDTNQVWRSKNGGVFSLLATVAGGTVTYTDTDVMPLGDFWTYEVRGVKSGAIGNFSNTVSAANNFSFAAQVTASFPDLILCYNSFLGAGSVTLTSLSAPKLRRVFGNLDTNGANLLASVNLSALVRVNVNLNLNGSACTTLTFPKLILVGGAFDAGSSFSLTSISFAASPNFTTFLSVEFDAALTTVSLFSSTFTNGCNMPNDACGFTQATVDAFLRRGVVSGLTTSFIDLSGGTSSAPSAAGLADKATLIGAGCTVITN